VAKLPHPIQRRWFSHCCACDSFNVGGKNIRLILPLETIEEIERTLASKSYFVKNQSAPVWETVKPLLQSSILPDRMIPADHPVSRDPNDDYLLVAMQLYEVDYLVTGDRDLLALGVYDRGVIIRPVDYGEILDRSGYAQE